MDKLKSVIEYLESRIQKHTDSAKEIRATINLQDNPSELLTDEYIRGAYKVSAYQDVLNFINNKTT